MAKITKQLFDELQSLDHAFLNEQGKIICNPIPKELAGGLEQPLTIEDRVRRAIDGEIERRNKIAEFEAMRDEDTFDLDDPLAVRLSGYELMEEEFPEQIITEPVPEPDPEPKNPELPEPIPENPPE